MRRAVAQFSGAPFHQLLFTPVAGEARGRLEGCARFLESPELLQKIAANARQQMIGLQHRLVHETVHDRKRGRRPLDLAHRNRAVEFDHRRGHQRRKLSVEFRDPRPGRFIRRFRRGMLALARARELGGAGGFYALQAAIVACHANSSASHDTPWPRIAGLYAELAALVRSPVIELNRAVAVGMAEGPAAALAIVDRLVHEPVLQTYHLLPSVRGDLLQKLGRLDEARAAFEAAASLAGNKREQDLLRRRVAELDSGAP